MNNACFVPALIGESIPRWKNNIHIGKYDLKYFTDKSFFKYGSLLTSAYYMVNSIQDFRIELDYPKNNLLIADSGGFQMASFARKHKKPNVTPTQILRWMESNADISMNLDVPPWDDFNASLKQSVENFKYFQDNRLNYDMKLYNILHGKTFQEMHTWYESVKDFNFDGWAYGVKPADNIYLQALGYMLLNEFDAPHIKTNFHMFGVSGIKNMIALSMITNHFDSTITFDSSSYGLGMLIRRFHFPYDIRHGIEFGRDAKKTMTSIPCNCPVCRHVTINDLYDQESQVTGSLLSLHNLYQYIEVNRIINALVSDDYALDEYSKSVGEYETVLNIRKMLKDYETSGTGTVYNNFKSLMVFRSQENPGNNLFRSWSVYDKQ